MVTLFNERVRFTLDGPIVFAGCSNGSPKYNILETSLKNNFFSGKCQLILRAGDRLVKGC